MLAEVQQTDGAGFHMAPAGSKHRDSLRSTRDEAVHETKEADEIEPAVQTEIRGDVPTDPFDGDAGLVGTSTRTVDQRRREIDSYDVPSALGDRDGFSSGAAAQHERRPRYRREFLERIALVWKQALERIGANRIDRIRIGVEGPIACHKVVRSRQGYTEELKAARSPNHLGGCTNTPAGSLIPHEHLPRRKEEASLPAPTRHRQNNPVSPADRATRVTRPTICRARTG